jgi:hypothetical protein
MSDLSVSTVVIIVIAIVLLATLIIFSRRSLTRFNVEVGSISGSTEGGKIGGDASQRVGGKIGKDDDPT